MCGDQMAFLQLEEEGMDEYKNLGKEILNTLGILEMIGEKLKKEMEVLNSRPTPKYYDEFTSTCCRNSNRVFQMKCSINLMLRLL
jgi:hypothetical protein